MNITLQPGAYANLSPDGLRVEAVVNLGLPTEVDDRRFKPLIIDPAPVHDAGTQKLVSGYTVEAALVRKTWSVVALTADEIAAEAAKTEKTALKDASFLTLLASDKAELETDQTEADTDLTEAQAFITLGAAATAAQRNEEVLNAAKRDKRKYQREKRAGAREKRLLRAVTWILKNQ